MSVQLAFEWKVLSACVAHKGTVFMLILMPGERQLVIKGLGALLAVHYSMGTAVVGFEFLCRIHPGFAHPTTIFLDTFSRFSQFLYLVSLWGAFCSRHNIIDW